MKGWDCLAEAVNAGRLTGADKIGERVGKVIGKHKVGKHFTRDITDTSFTFGRDEEKIAGGSGSGRHLRDPHQCQRRHPQLR